MDAHCHGKHARHTGKTHQIIERIPHSCSYQVTADGLTIALFFTLLTQRVLIPGLAELTVTGPSSGTGRAYKTAITELAKRASLAA